MRLKNYNKFKDYETWNLDTTFARFMLPRIIRFKEISDGYPCCYESRKKWEDILDEMIDCLTTYLDENAKVKIQEEKMDNFLKLFQENCQRLWW